MRILSITAEPVTEIPFLNAGRRAGGFYEDRLPVHVATADRLPKGVRAVIATGDLQGRERFKDSQGGPLRLLGVVLPERLTTEILPSFGFPSSAETGVLLAGDFYTVPQLDRRGGSGDVTAVWSEFGSHFAWVVGVAGNHDMFGSQSDSAPRFSGHVHYLDGGRVNLDGLKLAGIGGIIGNPRRPRRRSEEQYIGLLDSLIQHRTDVLLMHDGPDSPAHGLRGSAAIRGVIERHAPALVVRGHAHWSELLVELARGVQVLNVDARVVLIRDHRECA